MPEAPALVLAVVGAAWGLAADRLAARWPAHEDGSVRRVDWRTFTVAAIGAVALAAMPSRFGASVGGVLVGAYALALVILLATDLDQRLLPDIVTLPLVGFALVAGLLGAGPFVGPRELGLAVVAAIAVPGLLFAVSLPFGEGAIGLGDLKFLVSLGLLAGLERTVVAVIVGGLLSGVVVLLLLAARRVSLRSFIPFGPFLILGSFWALLLPR